MGDDICTEFPTNWRDPADLVFRPVRPFAITPISAGVGESLHIRVLGVRVVYDWNIDR